VALRGLIATTVLALLGAVPAPATATASHDPERCHTRSWIGGSVDLCGGALVYRDYVYDDYGADTGAPGAESTAPLANPAGDQRYEQDVNSADLVDLSIGIDSDTVHVSFELNALYHADSTVAAIAINTDNDPSTGGGEWPGLGVSSEGWDEIHKFDTGDVAHNNISGSFPKPPGDVWRLQAVTAINGGPVMNVAFRGTDEETAVGTWWEDKQAAALATGDISEFGHVVQVSDMTARVTRPAENTPGFHERVYTSRYTLPPGEGMSYEGRFGRHGETTQVCEQEFHFFGRYQPYGIYIPDGSEPHGMQLALHGCSANHASLIDQPGMQSQFGDKLNRIIIVPLGRGPYGYYSDISERDVLDVMKDVERNYSIDPDKVFSGGYSMGGYGALRMAMLYPDRFAGMVSWVGFTGDCFNGTAQPETGNQCASGGIGNVMNYVRNLRHIPSALLYMGQDELVHTPTWVELNRRFTNHHSPYVFYRHPTGEHFTLGVADSWVKESDYLAPFVRPRRVARVTFRTRSLFDYDKYGIHHDRAYWISRIRGHEKTFIDVGARSLGCGIPEPRLETSMLEGTDPVPWSAELRKVVGTRDIPKHRRLRLKLENVKSLRIDVDEACLANGPITYKVQTSAPVTIHFSDGRTLHFNGIGRYDGKLAI
jgi:poly(3-hydroxybutyrate) depolymerase